MQGMNRYLQDLLGHESELPEINADACVYSIYDGSDCHACVDACPSQAWVLDDSSLGLDTQACDGCGLCVAACPSGAISVEFPFVVRQFGGRMLALFACKQGGIDRNIQQLPCTNALGLRQLLLLYNSGVEHILIARGECENCQYRRSTDVLEPLQRLNCLLQERNKPPMKILQRSARLWEKIYRSDEIIPRGTRLSRREFLRGENQLIRRNLLAIDPLNLPECRTVPPGELLPEVTEGRVHWPLVPQMDASRCSGCDACINLCPTGALQLIRDEENTAVEYRVNPASCNGCGICVSVCEEAAVSIGNDVLPPVNSIALKQLNCGACGNGFHTTREVETRTDKILCRICETKNHNRNLFQVHGEA